MSPPATLFQQLSADLRDLLLSRYLPKCYLHVSAQVPGLAESPLITQQQAPQLLIESKRDFPAWAAYHGHRQLLKTLLQQGGYSDSQVALAAAAGGRLEILFFLMYRYWYLLQDHEVLLNAAAHGQLEVVRLLLAMPSTYVSCRILMIAAYHGHLEVIEKLLQSRMDPARARQNYRMSILCAATAGGQLELLQHYICHEDVACPRGSMLPSIAARIGNLEILEWMYRLGFWFETRVAALAAREGHLEILEWLHQRVPQIITGRVWLFAKMYNTQEPAARTRVLSWLASHTYHTPSLASYVPASDWYTLKFPGGGGVQRADTLEDLIYLDNTVKGLGYPIYRDQ